MQKIGDSTSTANASGEFTEGSPEAGVDATQIKADWLNTLQRELIAVVQGAGLATDKAKYDQVLTAIRVLNRQTAVLADIGTAGAYKAVNSPALAALPSTGHIQCINIASTNTGAATYQPDGLPARPIYGLGLQPLQGGELSPGPAVFMYLVKAGVNGGNGAWIILESLGGASQVAPATQTQHAAQLGQVNSLLTALLPKRAFGGYDYIRIPDVPGGLIIQWGPLNNTANATSLGSFPMTYPTACLAVLLTAFQAGGNVQAYATLNGKSLSGYSWNAFIGTGGTAPTLSNAAGAVQGHFISIGY